MKFEPKTEEEVLKAELCPEGLQPFTVLEAAVVESKSAKNAGKEMLKIKLNVHGEDGYDYHCYDYVAPWFMAHKFRHLFFALGLGADYEAGAVDPSKFIGREGWCEVGIQKGKGEYGPRNTIKDYNLKNDKAATPAPKQTAPAANESDDIPF